MRKWWWLSLAIATTIVAALLIPRALPPRSTATLPTSAPTVQAAIQYQRRVLPTSIVHTLVIPNRYLVMPAIATTVSTIKEFAQQSGAIAVLNAGFFDPKNQQTTSYITLKGKLVADPRQNERLMGNPDLANYLDKILDRSEFRQYRCKNTVRYDIARHSAPVPSDCQMEHSLGAGPQLLPKSTAESEGFVDAAVGRDALGSQAANARSAIGLTRDGLVIWLMAAQTNDPASGLSLPEVADLLRSLGVEKALNLDGGSSASLFFQGQAVYGKVNQAGDRVQRSVKSVLLVK
jgi:hypothetical protein